MNKLIPFVLLALMGCTKEDKSVTYTATHMAIGCQQHEIAEWWAFDDAAISRMDERALRWWRVWKPILQQIIATAPATPYAEKEKNK